MEIKTLMTSGYAPTIHRMRNPMDSWAKSDSFDPVSTNMIGPKDRELSIKLQKAGPEHCKHLRMIMAWADITAPLTWWKQFDCYRFGVEKISTSTMHTLMKHDLTADNFESASEDCYGQRLLETIEYINDLIRQYNKVTDTEVKRKIWEYAIQILPQSFLQKRTVMMSYAAIRNIVRQREGHKLEDWRIFIDWAKTLPENWMIFE